MEDEIKVNEYARDDFGNLFVVIGKYERGQFGEICVQLGDFKTKEFAGEQWERNIKIGNLIDLIEVGDYVNGYKVISIDRDVVTDIHTDCIELDLNNNYQYNFITINQIETIVTKEMMESISYKVTEM